MNRVTRIQLVVDAVMDMAAIRALPGGSKLSWEMTRLLVLVAFDGYELFPVREPGLQTETEFLKEFLQKYDNPRKLPGKWIEAYLRREKPQLAIDLLRAFDQTHRMEQKLRVARWQALILFLLVLKESVPYLFDLFGR